MNKPPLAPDEAGRLAAIARYGLTEPGREHAYDRIAELAAEIFGVPIALVSIVGRDFQCFRGAHGIDVPSTSRDVAFCAFAILSDRVMIVPDAQQDPRFRDNPFVTGAPHIRFYAGAPLLLDGQAIGTLCVIDTVPRAFGKPEVARLCALAAIVVEMLRMRLDRLAARQADERLRYIIDAMPTGLVVYDRDNRLVRSNRAFREMFFPDGGPDPEPGLTRQELLDRFETTGRRIMLAHGDKNFREHLCEGDRTEPYEARTSDGRWLSMREVRTPDGYLVSNSSDVTELKRREGELETQGELLRATLESVDDGIALFDAGRRLVVSNAKLPALLRLRDGQPATGTRFGTLANEVARLYVVVDGDAAFFAGPDPDLQAPGETREATFELPCGRMLLLKATARAGGTIILTCVDITEQKQVERLKAEFVSTVSHELRTPLTSISGALRILGGGLVGELSDKAREFVEIARKNCDRLSRLVNDLLEVDRIVSGEIHLEREPLDLGETLGRAIEHNRPYAADFGVRLELEDDGPGDPVIVLADEARILQVADNLLSNAIKYSPAGRAVTVAVAASGDVGRFSVSDVGPGVPEAFRARLFHRFTRADSTDHRERQGSGLGLSIARGIVEQHGGRIGFDSEPGRGASFWVELPLHRPCAPRAAGDEPPAILICVKDPATARALTATLEGAGVAAPPPRAATREDMFGAAYEGVVLELAGNGDTLDLVRSFGCGGAARPAMLLLAGLSGAGAGAIRRTVLSGAGADRAPAGKAGAQAPKPRILHVEDDADLLYLVAASLSDFAELDAAPDLHSARRLIAANDYDLVILDLMLPDGNGSELLSAIMDRSGASTPVLVFSAIEPDGEVAASVDATLTKSRSTIAELVQVSKQLTGRGDDS